ncbi:hypothetical protein BDZ45DRAFT_683028 [Acephala macrosclerotiorum]|nr:hypothetical protein BDZ45DRAFT_683028 [Acephala macrosclerotiorum]
MPRPTEQYKAFHARAAEDEQRLARLRHLKIPIYKQGFVHVVSRIGYKGFLRHTQQVNDSLLPFSTRKKLEQAWVDLVNEKYSTWETTHSETMKSIALQKALAEIEPSAYESVCKPQKKKLEPFELDEASMIFAPIVTKFLQAPRLPSPHPKNMYRIVVLPDPPAESEEKSQKKSRKRALSYSDEEDDMVGGGTNLEFGYETSTTIKSPAKNRATLPVKGTKGRKKTKNIVGMEHIDDDEAFKPEPARK